MMMKLLVVLALAVAAPVLGAYRSEFKELPGHKVKNLYTYPLPSTYVNDADLPDAWDWGNINGTSFVTKSLNQHLPQYCGSCWAHGALSSLADRIKIARGGRGADINLAIQFILNCGTEVAGSCYGGSHVATFEFIKENGFVPYDTCLQYEACSDDSSQGFCSAGNYKCSAMNTCRTCSTFTEMGGKCVGLNSFPNATIAEYGEVPGTVKGIKAELYKRGPIACGVNAEPILKYKGGIYTSTSESAQINHIVSITGWGVEDGTEYWNVRNSWGEYWGELGYFRIATGDNRLGIEENCAWATPDTWTELNFPCYEDGSNCQDGAAQTVARHYVDPATLLGAKPIRSALVPN